MLKIIVLLVAIFLLTGCVHPPTTTPKNTPRVSLDDPAPAGGELADEVGEWSGLSISDLNLEPPQLSFQSGQKSRSPAGSLMVASGRFLPVTNKDGQSIVAWRLVGEIYNGQEKVLKNGQMILEIIDNDNTRTLLPSPIQPGGFIPVNSQERSVYDVLISEPTTAQTLSIGIRKLDQPNDLIRLTVTDSEFVRQGDKYLVRGTIVNDRDQPVVGLLVRFWAVVDQDQIPEGAKTADQVVAVGTWQAAQDILAPSQSRYFEAKLVPLTPSDRDQMTTATPGLSVFAAATPLK